MKNLSQSVFFNNNKLSNEPLACYCIIFINYELCLSAYWQRKLTNEQPRSFVVTEKKIVPRSGPFDFRRVGGWIILKKSSCKYSLLLFYFFFQGKESTHLPTNTGPMVACINCSESFAMSAINDHHLVCNGGGVVLLEKRKGIFCLFMLRKIFKTSQGHFVFSLCKLCAWHFKHKLSVCIWMYLAQF